MRFIAREIDIRAGAAADQLELLSVSVHDGVIPRRYEDSGQAPSEDVSHYKRCWPGDVVVNKLRAFQGGVGVTAMAGMVSPAYGVLRLHTGSHPRFFHYLMRSDWFVGQMTKRLRGLGSPDTMQVRTPHINVSDIGEISVSVPSLEQQRRIADFLDAETSRIDELIRQESVASALLDERVLAVVVREVTHGSSWRAIGTYGSDYWIGEVPPTWTVAPLGMRYRVELGKMLNEERSAGEGLRPYLANVNVRWDGFDVDELRTMQFRDLEWVRYGVELGDVLVCEGGEVGRAAVWSDPETRVYFQKALHRLRPHRAETEEPRFLMYALMAAAKSGVFVAGSNKSTIDHLTAEKLSEHRFPFPPHTEQKEIVARLDALTSKIQLLKGAIVRQVVLLRERRQALISAAVTGRVSI